MVIIFEGIDKVGKTYLARKVSSALNIPIYKKDRERDIRTLSATPINFGNAIGHVQCWNNLKPNLIVDRFYWTEYVYGKLDRGYGSDYYLRLVEHEMLKERDNYLIVYVKPKDLKFSEEQHGSNLSEHLELYNVIYCTSSLKKIVCTYEDFDFVLSTIKIALKGELS